MHRLIAYYFIISFLTVSSVFLLALAMRLFKEDRFFDGLRIFATCVAIVFMMFLIRHHQFIAS